MMMESRDNARRWRDTAAVLVGVVLAVAVVSVVFDGGRSALAADDCQYGQYGQYGQNGQYGQGCAKVRPSLGISAPATAGIGSGVVPVAILESGDNPTGTLILRLHRPGQQCADPSQPPFWLAQVAVHGNGAYSPDPTFGAPSPFDQLGTWTWSATYTGDTRNELAHATCGAFTTTVTRRNPGLSLTNWTPAPYEPGVFAVARGEFSAYRPSGSLTVALHAPGDTSCTGTPAFAQSVTTSTFEVRLGPLGVGTWRLRATYPGDAFNFAVDSGCPAWVIVTKRSASLTPYVSPAVPTVGQAVAAGASVNGSSPTGTLTLRVFTPADPSCSSPVQTKQVDVTGAGPPTLDFRPTTAGTWQVTAAYSGDAANTAASLECGAHRIEVTKAALELDLVATPTVARRNDRLRARVAVRGGYRPAGRIEFRLFDPDDPSCGNTPAYVEEAAIVRGVARTVRGFKLPRSAAGTWNWTASYRGDVNNRAVTSGCGEATVTVVGRRARR